MNSEYYFRENLQNRALIGGLWRRVAGQNRKKIHERLCRLYEKKKNEKVIKMHL